MELRQLRYFVAVARERNFTRAAAALRIAQPPLSRQIQQLEDELGLELFQRGSRPVRLTEAGRLLLEQATQVLERIEDIKLLTNQLQADGKLHLSIGFVGSTLYGYLPEVIRSYRAERPRTELNLVELTTMSRFLPSRSTGSMSASAVFSSMTRRSIACCSEMSRSAWHCRRTMPPWRGRTSCASPTCQMSRC